MFYLVLLLIAAMFAFGVGWFMVVQRRMERTVDRIEAAAAVVAENLAHYRERNA